MSETSTPEIRALPEDYYGGFDVRQLADGGKRYRLPHTLFGTVMPLIMDASRLGMVLIATVLLAPEGLGGIAASLRRRWPRRPSTTPLSPKDAR